METMRGALGVRLGALAITRGQSARSRLLVVDGLKPDVVYKKLNGARLPVNRRRPMR